MQLAQNENSLVVSGLALTGTPFASRWGETSAAPPLEISNSIGALALRPGTVAFYVLRRGVCNFPPLD